MVLSIFLFLHAGLQQQEQPSRSGESILLFPFIALRPEDRIMNAARQTDARSYRLNECGNRKAQRNGSQADVPKDFSR